MGKLENVCVQKLSGFSNLEEKVLLLPEEEPSPAFGNPAQERARPTPPALTPFMHQFCNPSTWGSTETSSAPSSPV